jgi:Family of unknown function (DUF6884)
VTDVERVSVGLVACGATKLGRPAPARDLYCSPLFRKASAYAAATYDRWFILSAKHYLVDPCEVLDPYDVSLKGMTVDGRAHWASMVECSLRCGHRTRTPGRQVAGDPLLLGQWIDEGRTRGLSREVDLWLHAGADYIDPLLPLLARVPEFAVHLPLRGMQIGERLHWYTARDPRPGG